MTELVSNARQLYEESCELLRDKGQSLVSINFSLFLLALTVNNIIIILETARKFGE